MKTALYGLAFCLTILVVGSCSEQTPVAVQDEAETLRTDLPARVGTSPEIKTRGLTLAALTTTDLNSTTPTALANALVAGPGVSVSNVTYAGVNIAGGTFAGGTGIIGFPAGVILSSGNIASIPGPNVSDNITTDNGQPGDADLNGLIPGFFTFDRSVLEFDFQCGVGALTGELGFNYVFTSDEYNEFVNSAFNDVFGFFLNGANIALVPSTTTPVAINNVNCNNPFNPPTGSFCALFRNNDLSDGGGLINTEMDGLTVVLPATGPLNAGVNHIKLAIADAGDRILDSNVFIEGGSFNCTIFVDVDIKPGSFPNSINPKSMGVVPVAILGSDVFDVTDVDVTTLAFGPAGATPVHDPAGHLEDVNGDGFTDLVSHYRQKETGLLVGDTEACITGATTGGVLIEGCDSVRVLDK